MPRNCYILFILLCLVVTVIIGISLSNRYFQLQKEMNYSRSLKYSSHENRVYSEEKLEPQVVNKSVPLHEKVATDLQLPVVSSLKTPVKFKKRSKRQAISRKSNMEYISWNVGLNASHYQNHPLPENEKEESDSRFENEQLNILLRIEGKTRKESALGKIDNALLSMEAFAKSFFKNAEENETYRGIASLEWEKFNKSEVLPTDVVELRKKIKNLSSSSDRGRQGKFLLNMFGFRPKTKEETTTFSEIEAVSTDANLLAFSKNELLEEVLVKNDFATKSSQEIATRSESFISAVTPTLSFQDLANESHFDFRGVDEQGECLNCVTESLELFTLENKEESKDISEAKLDIGFSFTDEMLDKFCISLLNKVGESQHLSDEKIEFASELNSEDGSNLLKSSQNISASSLENTPDSIKVNDSDTDSTVLEDSFLVSNASDFENSLSRQGKFLDFGMFGFGSGRSAIIEESDLVDGGFDPGSIEESLPSISDCENFFREKQNIKMFPKPNLMDMISDPKIELEDFANATISPKLKEQQLQFLTGLLQNNLNNSVETFDDMEDTIEKPETGEKFINLTENEKKLDLEKVPQIATGVLDRSSESQEMITHSNIETSEVTQTLRNGRFISNKGFGSGSEGSRESSDSRRFLSFFGSGERSLETTVIDSAKNELGSGEFFGDTIFSDDARASNISEEGLFQEVSTLSDQEHRFFNVFGSGGRELTENVEFSTSETISVDNDCGDDCIHNLTPNPFHDCTNCEDAFENNDTRGAFSKNESECDDCYPEIIHEGYDYNVETTPNPSYDDCKNCDYDFENNDTRGAFSNNESECDDCYPEITYENHGYDDLQKNNTKIIQFVAESHTPTVFDQPISIYQSEELLGDSVGLTKSSAVDENECFDCNYENDLFSENNTTTDGENFKELSIFKSTVSELESIAFSGTDSITFTEERNLLHGSTPNPSSEKTEVRPKHFMETIFLTGSGDGGLFGDSGGPINLVEETTIISQAVVPRRGAKLLDDVEEDPCEDCMVDLSQMFRNKLEDSNQIDGAGVASSISISTASTLDDIEVPCDDCSEDLSQMFRNTFKDTAQTNAVEAISSIKNPTTPRNPKRFGRPPEDGRKVAVSKESIPSQAPTVIVPERTKKFQTVFCTSAKECNNVLNERCVAVNASSICSCSRGYVRHKETNKCVAMRVVETSLKLPAEEFNNDLENPFSPKFQQTKKNAEDTMWLLLKDMPELLQLVAEVDAIKFKPGSLIVSYNIVFGVESDSEEKLILNLEYDLQRVVKDANINREAALDIREASVLPIINAAIDPCTSSEFNYCSKDAYCVSNEALPGRFSCYCKEHYRDVSSNPLYVGETCIDICPPDYCGSYGHCEILQNGQSYCLCSWMYFGRRCEIPGIILLSFFAVVACISLAALLALAFRKRCRTRNYGGSRIFHRSQETGTHLQVDGRLSDEIALGENPSSKVTKFTNISTPMQQIPAVKVTRPTFDESSVSYEFDSTFDVSPQSESNREQKSTV